MSGCLDHIRCSCDFLEPLNDWLKPKRNMFASITAGTLFALGWWFVIDATAEHFEPLYAAYHICGICSTIALIMINAVSTGQVTGDTYTEGCLGKNGARAWLFVGFVFAFGGLIGSLWIFIQEFLVRAVIGEDSTSDDGGGSGGNSSLLYDGMAAVTNGTVAPTSDSNSCFPCWWQGVAFFLQNFFIFLSNLVFKFGRTEELDVW